MNRTHSASCALLVAALFIAPDARAWGEDPVAVDAGADKAYVDQKFGGHAGNSKAETYVFAQGSHFGGTLRDSSLDNVQFTEIARDLAPDLAKHQYYPTKDQLKADLLIVVHWGVTDIKVTEDKQIVMAQLNADIKSYNSQTGIRDPGPLQMDLAEIQENSDSVSMDHASNSDLLGYTAALRKEEYLSQGMPNGMTNMDYRLRDDLAEERYFVILDAYDRSTIKGGKKGTKPKLLWSAHMSVRAVGRNFTDAVPAMSKVAADYFGQNTGLVVDAQKVPEGLVKIGVPKTVGDEKQK